VGDFDRVFWFCPVMAGAMSNKLDG
jgi:hypothetical protein